MVGQTTAVRADSAVIRKQFASIVELDDAVAEQAPALPGLIGYYPRCEVVRCGPFRAPRLMLAHASVRCRATRGDGSTSVTPALPHGRFEL
jgi:hypothetical protein